MKRYIIFGLAGIVMGWIALPAIAAGGSGGKSGGGGGGSTASAGAARPMAGSRPALAMQNIGAVASRQNISGVNVSPITRFNGGPVPFSPGANAGTAIPADSVASGTGNGDHRRHRHRNNDNNNGQGSIVVVTSGNDGNGYPPWGNAGNYGAPWGYANGMGYQNMPYGYGAPMMCGANNAYPAQEPPGMAQPESPDFVVAVQRDLRRRGFYRGVINGNSDDGTRAAIRSFEASMGMPVTGVIGMPLMRALGFMQ